VTAWVFIDGEVVPGDRAMIPVFDRGFLYGDSVYEVLRTYRGAPVWLDDHLDRLRTSGERLGFDRFPSLEAVGDAVTRTLQQADAQAAVATDWYIRIVVTRGGGPVALAPSRAEAPRLIVLVKELSAPAPALYERGIGLAIVDIVRNPADALDPAAKSGNYLNNILALRQALARGADEALMCNVDGFVSEGASSNVFVVRKGVLRTPPTGAGILHGITRSKVLSLAGEVGMKALEENLTPADIQGADEVFISSSVREVMPVTRVDDAVVGDGAPGEATRRLHVAYRAAVDRQVLRASP